MNTESYAQIKARFKRLHGIWSNMKYRCYGKRNAPMTERHYKSKGISVCDEWIDNWAAFYDWAVTHGYEDDLTIDRIDPNGDYCPENCQWVTRSENSSRAQHRSDTANLSAFYYARIFANKHVSDVVRDLHVSKSSVQKWENGNHRPRVGMVCLLARYYGVSVNDLLGKNEKNGEDAGCRD